MQTGGNPLVTFSYDDNGNLTDDGSFTYTYDYANRVKSVNNGSVLTQFAYDGNGDRHRQQRGSTVTDYLLDLQPGLAKVLAQTESGTVRYLHGPRGIHAEENNSGAWTWMLQDGLGSVRGVVASDLSVNGSTGIQNYTPYGEPQETFGSTETPFGFTGEQYDTYADDTLYLRARHYQPAWGVFPSLDPFEGMMDRAMSLNGYSWVEGNTPNMVDPQGLIPIPPIQICFPFIGCVSGDGNHTGVIGAVDTIGDVANDTIYDVGTGAGNILSDAAILPHMALHEDPDLVRQAIAQYLNGGGCGENWQFAIFGSVALKNPWIRNIIKTPVGVTVGAIGVGIGLGISGLLGVNQFHNSLTQDNVRDNVRDDVREDENDNSCDPDTFKHWWNQRPLAGGVYNLRWYEYEQKVAREAPGTIYGVRPRRIPAGIETIDADGALGDTCQLIDAKFGSSPPWADIPYEFRRYRLAITVPNGTPGAQPSGLIVRTNNESLRSFYEDTMRTEGFTIGVDGFVEICTVSSQGVVTCR